MKLNRNFTLLLYGQSLANIGDVLYMVSVISIIFNLTGSATAASFVPFTITTSMFVSSLITPLLIGKINLKWLLAGTQTGKTIILIALGFLILMLTESNYFIIFIGIGSIAFLDGCANPISQTLIPHYVKTKDLLRANGILQTVTQFIQAIMWFLGSLFLMILSPQQLIWVVSCIFMFSSILLCLLENVKHKRKRESIGKFEQIKVGWKTLSQTPVLKKIAWMDCFETIAGTVWIAAIIYVFVSDALQVGENWWGYINGSYFLGLIVGGLFCIKFASLVEKKLSSSILIGSIVSCLITVFFGINSIPMIALLLSLFIGFFEQVKSIPQQTVIQTSVEQEKLATVYTSLGAIGTGLFGVGALIMGIFADWLGIRTVFIISGILLGMVSVIVYKNKRIFVQNGIEQ